MVTIAAILLKKTEQGKIGLIEADEGLLPDDMNEASDTNDSV